MIDDIKSEIQCLRDGIGVEFQRWYDEAKQLASYISTEEEMQKRFQWFSVIGQMYLLTHLFLITRDDLAFLLLIYYCKGCRTVSLQTTANQ